MDVYLATLAFREKLLNEGVPESEVVLIARYHGAVITDREAGLGSDASVWAARMAGIVNQSDGQKAWVNTLSSPELLAKLKAKYEPYRGLAL